MSLCVLGQSSGKTLLRTDVEDQLRCRFVERAVSCRKRARSERVNGEGVDAERHEADEEMLSDAPGRSSRDANADEAVGDKAYAGFVADPVLEVDADLTVEP